MKNIYFLLILGFIVVNACSRREDKKTAVSSSDGPEIKSTSFSEKSPYLSQDSLTRYLDKAGHVLPNKQAGKPFSAFDYNKVIAYEYNGDEEQYPDVMGKNAKFIPVITKQRALNQSQADDITSHLSNNSTYGNTIASCFEPHLGLVFYKDNKMVMQVSVCLLCNYLQSSLEIPAESFKKRDPGTGNKIPERGFSKTGRKKIKTLCDELNFDYSRKETMFDK